MDPTPHARGVPASRKPSVTSRPSETWTGLAHRSRLQLPWPQRLSCKGNSRSGVRVGTALVWAALQRGFSEPFPQPPTWKLATCSHTCG